MFETFTYLALQQYWWVIISLLGAMLVFLMFVQGGQTLIYTLGKTEDERSVLINLLGRKWELTFTTLVTFGGAFFASFPLFYSTSFGGAYWVWMLILVAFVIQAISYEYRRKPDNFLGQKTFENLLLINGILGPVLIGTAVATFFTGSEFSVNKLNITLLSGDQMPVISEWKGAAHGLEAAINLQNLSLGLTVFFLARVLALLYFMNRIANQEIMSRIKKQILINAIPFLFFFLVFSVWLMLSPGYEVNSINGAIFTKPYKYLENFMALPLVSGFFLSGVFLTLTGILFPLLNLEKWKEKAIWLAGPGAILVVFSLFLIAGLNHTAYYPSSYDPASSLTIENSSSSRYTLIIMSYVSLLVPFVIAYIWIAWRSMDIRKINIDEINNESHKY